MAGSTSRRPSETVSWFKHSARLQLALFKRSSTRFILALFIIVSLLQIYISYYQPSPTPLNNSVLDSLKYRFKLTEFPSANVLKHIKEQPKNLRIKHEYPTITDETNADLQLLDFDRDHIKVIYPEVINSIYEHTDLDAVDWSKYAYVLYATSSDHMCNAMMIFGELRKFKTRAKLVLLVREEFLTQPENYTFEYETLTNFSISYDVELKSTKVIKIDHEGVQIWTSSFTKLMVFNETDYERIIFMDSDGILTRGNLDELFFLPPCKLAVNNAYWITNDNLNEVENLREKYNHKAYGFQAMTYKQRNRKINNLLKKTIEPYYDPYNNDYLPIKTTDQVKDSVIEKKAILEKKVNERNFYTNVYNELPNYVTTDEFQLTNIVMVIQPSPELFDLVADSIKNRNDNEFDMDLVQNRLFNAKKIPTTQLANSIESNPDLTFKDRLNDIPELLIIPHQVYGALTQELNLHTHHASFMVDAHEQVFEKYGFQTSNGEPAYYYIEWREEPGDFFYEDLKYIHFSDAPIPKPWFRQDPTKDYMRARTRCPSHPDFTKEGVVRPREQTGDCSNGKNWEIIHSVFKSVRKEVCHLELIDTNSDTYYDLIN